MSATNHLTKDARRAGIRSPQLPTERDREFYCVGCHARVTKSADGAGEVCRRHDCDHKCRLGEPSEDDTCHKQ